LEKISMSKEALELQDEVSEKQATQQLDNITHLYQVKLESMTRLEEEKGEDDKKLEHGHGPSEGRRRVWFAGAEQEPDVCQEGEG